MINIVCENCGYKLPLSSKNKPTILNSTQRSHHRDNKYNNDVVCPKCGKVLTKGKKKMLTGRRK